MKEQIENIMIKVDEGTMPVQQALSELLLLFSVSGSLQINWDDVYEEANHRSPTAFDEYVKSICNDR